MENFGETLLQAMLQGLANAASMLAAAIAQNPWPVVGFAALAVLSALTARLRRRRAR